LLAFFAAFLPLPPAVCEGGLVTLRSRSPLGSLLSEAAPAPVDWSAAAPRDGLDSADECDCDGGLDAARSEWVRRRDVRPLVVAAAAAAAFSDSLS
jgi:hypothetical protein